MIKKLKGAKKRDLNANILRKVLRILAEPIALLLSKTSITPNQVTFLYTIISIIVAYLFSQGTYETNLLAGILLFLVLILDKVDGSLARIKKRDSDYGFWLDRTSNDFTKTIIFFGLAIGIFKQTENVTYVFWTFVVILTYILTGLTYEIFKFLMKSSEKIISSEKSKHPFLKQFVYGEPFVPFLVIIFSFTNLLPGLMIFLGVYGILFTIVQYIMITTKIKKQLSQISKQDSSINESSHM